MEKLLLTPEEVARVLSIGRSKVYELISNGELESLRIGASRRISVRAVERFIAERGSDGEGELSRSA